MVAVTNISGSNPGPSSELLPDTVSLPVGNVWKVGSFSLTLSPTAVANGTSAEQTFAMTGLLTTDYVAVNKPTAQAGLGIAGTRVSASDVLAITFGNFTTATITPTASEAYRVLVVRVMPNWSAPSSGTQLDW